MSRLNGSWIEIFRAGDYGDRGQWTAQDLDRLVAAYDTRLQPAPVVVGHPRTDSPAYGWVARLRRAGQSLWAQLEKVDRGFEDLLRNGRFRQRSVALYRHFAPAGGPYLRHVGFLGAQPPAVKGLAPVRFFAADTDPEPLVFHESLPTTESQEEDVTHHRLEKFFDHLRGFFTDSAQPEDASFADRLAQIEQRIEALTPAAPSQPEPAQRPDVAAFVETLRAAGKFPPAYDRLGVVDFLHRLAALSQTVCHSEFEAGGQGFSPADSDAAQAAASEGDRGNPHRVSPGSTSPDIPLLAWFQEFLTRLPQVIDFGEISAPAGDSAPAGNRSVIRFAEPRRGVEIDPESVDLAERAETLAASEGIPYGEALTRLRTEARNSRTPI